MLVTVILSREQPPRAVRCLHHCMGLSAVLQLTDADLGDGPDKRTRERSTEMSSHPAPCPAPKHTSSTSRGVPLLGLAATKIDLSWSFSSSYPLCSAMIWTPFLQCQEKMKTKQNQKTCCHCILRKVLAFSFVYLPAVRCFTEYHFSCGQSGKKKWRLASPSQLAPGKDLL